MAKTVDELPVYVRLTEVAVEISALLERPALRKDFKLRRQISEALDSAEANIEEGFEQGTDHSFAYYLTRSKGSVGEVIGHLRRARRKDYISPEELAALRPKLEEIGRMLGGFIKYLEGCDYKDRGYHKR